MITCTQAALFSVLIANSFAQTSGNFAVNISSAGVSVPAGASVTMIVRVVSTTGYSQPIYLTPGAVPEGLTVLIPSPVVAGQTVNVEVRAAADAKQQTYTIAIYSGGGGENHSSNFPVTVLPEGMPASAPETAQLLPAFDSAVVQLPAAPPPPLGAHWVGSWGASAVTPSNNSGAYYLTNVTVRQIAHLSIGTLTGIRLRLSNALGRDPVSFGSVHVACWAGDNKTVTSAITSATDRVVTFSGSELLTIPAGTEVLSDPIVMPLPAGADLAVSIYIPKTSNVPASMHTFGNQTAYFSLGNTAGSATMPNAATDTVRPYLTGIDVDAPNANAVVALGDSLTDGMFSSRDQNARWPDDLARRLHSFGVVNAGIAGNCALMNCMGPNVQDRFRRDVLNISGVKFLIIQVGANDIGHVTDLTLAALTDAYTSMVELAHGQGIVVYGATIPPFGGSNYFTAAHEQLRQQVNAVIRSGRLFDGVIDFDKALADPQNTAYLLAAFSGDKNRPNDAGYQVMANSVDPKLFGTDVENVPLVSQ